MIVSVRHPEPGVFLMTVRGLKGDINSDTEYETMDAVWTAAREVSEKHADFLTARAEGWNV